MDKGVEKTLKEVGRRLAELRQQQSLSVAELGARSGIDSQLIERIEAGQVDFEITVIFSLVEGLGVRPRDLFGG
ncbi:MAG: helix-turn-helix transcriptional regulator [Bacteroidetes bacterium]|nr:helix-turn-helix transcriptional regulator [Bacteroidota bacterium]